MNVAAQLVIDTERLMKELHDLASFTEPAVDDAPGSAVTRVVFTPTDRLARDYLNGLVCEAGLAIREDAVGNTFFRWEGTEPALAAIATGSHIDAIPNAGMYDGTVGVVGGFEAIRALQRSGFVPRRSIELILFTSEEPTRFGIGCLGSRMLSGALSPGVAAELKDKDGLGLDEVRTEAGFCGSLDSVQLVPGAYDAFVELHIEQGPLLEQTQIPIGVVTHIAAPASFAVTLEGEGGHAGALLMPSRHDALVAAAELIQAIEAAALTTGVIDTVATVGMCEVFPGAVNSVPSRVRLSLDVRDTDAARLEAVLAAIHAAAEKIAARRGVAIALKVLNKDQPAVCDSRVIAAIEQACAVEAIAGGKMVSRAYHDSLFMARIVPMAMIFIPCRGGVSHRPDEYAAPEDIALGVAVLARTLATLSAA